MDVGRFLAVLKSKCLYFARPHELDDKWEAHQLPRIRKELLDWAYIREERWQERYGTAEEALKQRSSPEMIAESEAQLWDHFTHRALVNCWHCNEGESIAMWKLYTSGAEGVAIQSSIRRLRDALNKSGNPFSIAPVQYNDHETSTERAVSDPAAHFTNPILSVFSKRKVFSHEREIRVVIDYLTDFGSRVHVKEGDLAPEIPVEFDNKEPGRQIPVDLEILVSRIVVSPSYPSWAVPALQDAVYAAGVQVKIANSSVHEVPFPAP